MIGSPSERLRGAPVRHLVSREALFEYIEAHRAHDLVEAYFDALCVRLSERLDIRVAAGSSEGELRYLLLDG